MADDFADVILTGFSSPSQGKVILNHAAKLKVTERREQTYKHTMNRRRLPRGFASGPREIEAELECAVGLPEEIEWHTVGLTNEFFLFSYELGDGGRRYQLVDCKLGENALEGGEDGNIMRSLTFKALDHRPVLSDR